MPEHPDLAREFAGAGYARIRTHCLALLVERARSHGTNRSAAFATELQVLHYDTLKRRFRQEKFALGVKALLECPVV